MNFLSRAVPRRRGVVKVTLAFFFLWLGFSAADAGAAPAYAVVISTNAWNDPGWREVAETLRSKHQGQVVSYDSDVHEALAGLRNLAPRYVGFVTPPAEATRAFVAEVHRMTRGLDADPYLDCFWGIVTGYDASNALAIAREKRPLVIRKVVSGTPVPLERVEEGVWFSELTAGQVMRKQKGRAPAEEKGPTDSTRPIADALSQYQPDLFITSGHATERDWQIGFAYKNGYFRCEDGLLYGLDTSKKRIPIYSPNPKVYLAVGNCLMGHIDGTNAMALAFMNGAGVRQMMGYTVNTWYGYAGWGCLDYFYEQPGRYSLAEAFAANEVALVHRLQTFFPELAKEKLDLDKVSRPVVEVSPAAREAGLRAQDGFGLLYDRDAVAFYGDPAWDARLAPARLAWDQALTRGTNGTWVFEIKPTLGERSFDGTDRNGSQRGDRPFVEFFGERMRKPRLIEGAQWEPVITENFILVPMPEKQDASRPLRVVFEAS